MPAATTHVEFAKDVYKHLPSSLRRKITNRKMFLFGSQGPDMLFFSHASALPGSLHKYGELMHQKKVPEVIAFFDGHMTEDSDLLSYFLGFLCHYSLDSLAHPLVCAIAKDMNEKTGIHEGCAHVTGEAEIDVWLLHQRGRTIKDYNVWKDLKVNAASRKKLADVYQQMFREVYDIELPLFEINLAIMEVSVWTHALFPNKYTHAIVYGVEDAFHAPHSFSGMMLYGKSDVTFINLEHRSYTSHYSPDVKISASFPELYGEAVQLAVRLLQEHSAEDFTINFEGVPLTAVTD